MGRAVPLRLKSRAPGPIQVGCESVAPSPATASHDRTVAALVFATLLAFYLLTFSGQFRSIDEYAMYARVESLPQGQGLATPQL